MSACRARRPRRSEPILSNAARTNACQCRRDAGWPGKRGPHRALAVRFRRSHHAPRSWPFARGGSARVKSTTWQAIVVVVPMRQHSCHSAPAWSAAGVPTDGAGWRAERPRACRVASAGCRGAQRRERTSTGTRSCPMPGCRSPPVPIAAQVAGVRAVGDGGALPRAVARRAGSPV